MRKLSVFNSVSLDGYFSDANNDVSWAHSDDPEWNAFVGANAAGEGTLVFGRVTHDMMASYWPTPHAARDNPTVAEGMNRMQKIVFSRTLDKSSWANTRIIKDDPAAAMRKIKSESGPDMAILGSGSIVSRLAGEGLVDEFQFALVPVVLGKGRTMFDGIKNRVAMKLIKSEAFGNGYVFSRYAPRA